MQTPEDEAWEEMERRQGGGGFPAKRAMAADKLQEPTMEREALKLALEALEEAHYKVEHKQDAAKREQAITAIKEALAQPWPDLNKRDRESYQKGHNDGVAHHKQSVKAAQPAQEPSE